MSTLPPDLYLTDTEIAWIAGIFEGEGTFGIDDRVKNRSKESTAPPGCLVSMTDQDVILKLANMLKKKNFKAHRLTKGGKTEYILNISYRKTLRYLLPLIYPHLGQRRRGKVQKCLDVLNAWKTWYDEGGRSRAAAKSGPATAKKKELLETKSDSEKIS